VRHALLALCWFKCNRNFLVGETDMIPFPNHLPSVLKLGIIVQCYAKSHVVIEVQIGYSFWPVWNGYKSSLSIDAEPTISTLVRALQFDEEDVRSPNHSVCDGMKFAALSSLRRNKPP